MVFGVFQNLGNFSAKICGQRLILMTSKSGSEAQVRYQIRNLQPGDVVGFVLHLQLAAGQMGCKLFGCDIIRTFVETRSNESFSRRSSFPPLDSASTSPWWL